MTVPRSEFVLGDPSPDQPGQCAAAEKGVARGDRTLSRSGRLALTTVNCAAISRRPLAKAARATKNWRNFARLSEFAQTTRMPPTAWATHSSNKGNWMRRSRISARQSTRIRKQSSARTTTSGSRSAGKVSSTRRSPSSKRPSDCGQSSGAQNNLTLALLKKGEVQGAIDHGRKALQIQPNNPELHNNLAVALLRDGQVPPPWPSGGKQSACNPTRSGDPITLAWILSTSPEPSFAMAPKRSTRAAR